MDGRDMVDTRPLDDDDLNEPPPTLPPDTAALVTSMKVWNDTINTRVTMNMKRRI